jgi:hypothetical protein
MVSTDLAQRKRIALNILFWDSLTLFFSTKALSS